MRQTHKRQEEGSVLSTLSKHAHNCDTHHSKQQLRSVRFEVVAQSRVSNIGKESNHNRKKKSIIFVYDGRIVRTAKSDKERN